MLKLAVILNLMPPKGMTLPFVSYGGSSLLANYVLVVLLLRLSATELGTRGRPLRHRRAAAREDEADDAELAERFERRLDTARHRSQMDGDVLGLRDHLSVAVEDRGRAVDAFLDVR